jgi:hypothetical protein
VQDAIIRSELSTRRSSDSKARREPNHNKNQLKEEVRALTVTQALMAILQFPNADFIEERMSSSL